MFRNKLSFFFLLSFFLVQYSVSQNNTNSPYTRYGYGELSDANSGEQHAMGGIGLGLRKKTSINTLNPASYSAVDSMTFMFDVGASGTFSSFTNSSGKSTTKYTGNLNYITLQFPVSKYGGFSAGLMPYSSVGYNYSIYETKYPNYTSDFDTITARQTFLGSGGINQVYAGLSIAPIKHLSVGVNAYYMFGTIYNQRSCGLTSASDSIYELNSLDVTNFRFRYGIQYYNTFGLKHDLTIGAVYEAKQGLKGMATQLTSGALVENADTTSADSKFELPQMFGLGVYYTYDKKLSLGVDYSFTQWSNALFRGEYSLQNRSKLSLGTEYTPDARSRKLSKRMSYRAGFSMSDSYYKVNNNSAKNYTFSLGFGFPVFNTASNITMVNTSFEYGRVGASDLLRENYFKFVLNLTFNEHWFFKSKL